MTTENFLARSVLIPAIIKILCEYYDVTPATALRQFYESKTAACLADESLGLYGQSPLYNANLFILEKDGAVDVEKLNRLAASAKKAQTSHH